MKNKINEECFEIYKKKIEINNKINSFLKQKNCECVLIDLKNEEGEILKQLNIYVVKLMTYLWEDPKLVVNLLSTADKNDIRENLSPLILNNFYENILSPNYIEDHLLYVLSLLLKDEINNINSVDDFSLFLNDTPCGIILQQLTNKKDIQSFFKIIISKIVENLETNYSNIELKFNLSKIEESIEKREKAMKNKNIENFVKKFTKRKSKNIRNSLGDKNILADLERLNEKDFNKINLCEHKYFTNLTKEKIIEEKEKYNKEHKEEIRSNNIFYDICINKIISEEQICNESANDNNSSSSTNKYDNDEFLSELDNDEKIKKVYLENFYCVIEIINKIISNILDNLYYLPYSVKCLCKIISILIKKKFPQFNVIERNKFIGRFFFSKLFLPFLMNPGFEALITNYLISQKTLKNLLEISKILVKFYSGQLFPNDEIHSYYTPFNIYFIEKMPDIINIFEEIQNVTLPNYIERLLNDELPEDFKFNYFNENPDEIIFHRSICFTIDDVSIIIKTIGLNKEMYFTDQINFGLKKTYEKLCSNNSQFLISEISKKQILKRNLSLREERSFKFLIDKTDKDKNNKNNQNSSLLPKKYYFLVSDILTNEKYEKIFNIEQKESNFGSEEFKRVQNETEMVHNNIIRVKNSICCILYNYQYLNKKDFSKNNINDTKSIFNEIKKYIESDNYIVDDSIPTQWYLNSLFEYMKKIPQKYKDNDYELLYNEIENDINESIKILNFDTISVIHEKINYAKRLKNNYEKKKKSIKKIKLNEKINRIIEKEAIPITFYFDYNKNLFKIEKANINIKELQFMDDFVIEDTKKKCMICKTIKIFTNEFPDLTKYQSFQDIDLFELEKNLSIPERLEEYLDIIKEHVTKKQFFNEKNLDMKMDKIYDYIFRKLYDKIFPKENQIDDRIFRQCVILTWIKPEHFIENKTNYVFDGFLPDVNDYLKKLEKQKSPRKKFNYMSKIFESIRNLVKFNGDDILAGVDDQMPILNYALIKARPLRIFSNCKFMELYIGKKKNKKEDNELIQLLSLCEYINNMSYSKLLNVTKEEYDLNCQESAKNDIFRKET